MHFKTYLLLFILGLFVFFSTHAQRLKISLNDNWKFLKLDVNQFEKPELDDRYWKTLNLPHTWNAEDAFDDERGYYQGAGCYRRHWDVPQEWKGKAIYLEFEGVGQQAEVYINGQFVGRHLGGYTAFRYPVAQYLQFGASNLVAIKASNAYNPDLAPLSADFNFYGGIYRPVWVEVAEPIHILPGKQGDLGLQLEPKYDGKTASLFIQAQVLAEALPDLFVETSLLDATGKLLASERNSLKVKQKGSVQVKQKLSVSAKDLKLWSPDSPHLYTVKVSLLQGKKTWDRLEETTAFYQFSLDPNRGATLNGKPIKLMGACRHQDMAGIGNALPDEVHRADMQRLKEMGGNFVRIAHYPQSRALLRACDQLGILAWEEIPIVNEITPTTAFFQSCAGQLQEMIAQHRNHPSIVMWGYMNEVFLGFGKQKTDSAKKLHTSQTVRLARYLDSIARKTDPVRLTTMALHNSTKYNESGIADVANVTGWNLYHGWYHDEFADFGTFMDQERKQYPNRIHMISEFGAGSDTRLQTLAPNIYDFSPQYQLLQHQSYLKQIFDRPWIAGGTMWNLVDFGSEGRKETMPHINNKGLFTMDRKPKDAYYLYKAFLTDKPMAHLAVADWGGKVLVSKGKMRLRLISNLPVVYIWWGKEKIGEVVLKDRMGEFETAVSAGPLVLRLETADGKVLGQHEIEPVPIPDALRSDFTSLAVNVGSNCAYQHPETGQIWFPSKAYEAGSWGSLGGRWYSSGKGRMGSQSYIDLSKDQPLFQTMQDSISGFKADVPAGTYEVEMLFAELEPSIKPSSVLYDLNAAKSSGKSSINRIFHIEVNNQLWKSKFEPAKEPGGFKACTIKGRLSVAEQEGITLKFIPVVGNPILNGVKITKL